jgi:hypothetical protein
MQLLKLIGDFLDGKISAPVFEHEYIREWRKARDFGALEALDDSMGKKIDTVFSAVDAYCSDSVLRSDGDLDGGQLYQEVFKQFPNANG